MFEEDVEVWVSLGIDGGFKYWYENIFYYFFEVWKEIFGSEYIIRSKNEENLGRKRFLGLIILV